MEEFPIQQIQMPAVQSLQHAEYHVNPVHMNYSAAFRRAVSASPTVDESESAGYRFFSLPYVQLILAFAQAIANQSNAFCCQFNILPLKRELDPAAVGSRRQSAGGGKPDNRKIMTVIHVSCLFITVVYVVFGFCGYAACGDEFI